LIYQLEHLWASEDYTILWIICELGDQTINKGSRKRIVKKSRIINRVKKKRRGKREGTKSDAYISLSPILKVKERKAKYPLSWRIRTSMRIASKKVDKW